MFPFLSYGSKQGIPLDQFGTIMEPVASGLFSSLMIYPIVLHQQFKN